MTDLAEPTTAVMADPAALRDGATTMQAMPGDEVRYAGLTTRWIAFVVDAALISLVAFLVGAGTALVVSLFHFSNEARTLLKEIGGAAYILWAAGYFVGFWSATGQTPGDRVMQIRVVTASFERVKPRRAIVRCVGLVLAALPLFLGYVPILFDRRRRGFADWLARTVVLDAPGMSVAQAISAKKRGASDAARAPRA